MGALRERAASNSIAAIPISTLVRGIRIFMIGGSMKTGDRVFSNLQRPLLNVHPAVVRMSGILMM